jgi:hypothetical protein
MAAVTVPGYFSSPPESPVRKRRWWLVGLVVVWILVVAGLGFRSVRNDPPTVPEQRDIAQALPVLERATGALLAAATAGTDRAVVLGELRARDCNITPLRPGVEATRNVTIYVAADRALKVLEEIAAGLPDDYRAEAADSSGGRRIGLHADAGGFIAIDAAADSGAQVVPLRASTGCRPTAEGAALSPADATATSAPASLTTALRALGGSGPAKLREIACPDGGVGRTYTVDGVRAPEDLGRSLQGVIQGAIVVRAEPAGWAYHTGADSVVIVKDGSTLRVNATTACG